MSYSNETETLKLPQYSAEDKPTWLVDMNNAFANIDSFAKSKNEEIENIHTHEQETANTLESVARTLETQSDTNTDIEKRITKNTEDLTLLTTHVNEHDESLKAIESEINGLSTEVENKAEKTEVETLQENLVSANNAINKLDEEIDITDQKRSDLENLVGSSSINTPVELAYDEDLNNIVNTGFYYKSGGNEITNLPVITSPRTNFALMVYKTADGGVVQHFICGSTKSGSQYTRYGRTINGTPEFGEWHELVLRENISKILEEEGCTLSVKKQSTSLTSGVTDSSNILTGTKYMIYKYALIKNLLQLSGQINLKFSAVGTSGLSVIITKPITDFISGASLDKTDVVNAPLISICNGQANTVGYVKRDSDNLVFTINSLNMPESYANKEQVITFAINLLLA